MDEVSRHKHAVMRETCYAAGAEKHLSGPRSQVQCYCVRTLVESSVILQCSGRLNSKIRSPLDGLRASLQRRKVVKQSAEAATPGGLVVP